MMKNEFGYPLEKLILETKKIQKLKLSSKSKSVKTYLRQWRKRRGRSRFFRRKASLRQRKQFVGKLQRLHTPQDPIVS